MFKQSEFFRNRHQYLKDGRYLLADKGRSAVPASLALKAYCVLGYPSTPCTVRPFSQPEIRKASPLDQRRMKDFNVALSSVRISVEHAFGAIKGRFPSLRYLGTHADPDEIYRLIEAILVFHNILLFIGDRPEHILKFSDVLGSSDRLDDDIDLDAGFGGQRFEDRPEVPAHETLDWLKRAGHELRLRILNDVFPIENYN